MRHIYTFIFILLISNTILAQSTTVENVRKSLNLGNSKELIKNFNDQVEISLNGSIGLYNKIQAESVLRDFFNTNNVVSFKYIHNGCSNSEQLKYYIGSYSSKNASYRVLIRFKPVDNLDLVYNLKFIKE